MKRIVALVLVGLIGFLVGVQSSPSLMAKDIPIVASSKSASPQLVELKSPFAPTRPKVTVLRVETAEPYFNTPHWVTQTTPGTGLTALIDGSMFVDAGQIPTCPGAQAQDLPIGEYKIPGPAIVHGWTNKENQDQSLWQTLIHTDEVFTFLGVGGKTWWFSDACSTDVLRTNLDPNLPFQSWQQLHDRGLVQ